MRGRQIGVPMTAMMEAINTTEMSAEIRAAFRALVIDAYKKPRFSTPAYRENAVRDFANEIAVVCYAD